MVKLSQTLNLIDPWQNCEQGKITHNELAEKIANRVWRALVPYQDETIEGLRQELIETFRFASKNIRLSADDLDDLMEELYDWADMSIGQNEKVCWIKIVSERSDVSNLKLGHG